MLNQVKNDGKLDKKFTNKIKSLSSKAENTSGWYYKYKNEIDAMNAHHGPYNLFITNSADTSSAYIKNFLSQIRENYTEKEHWKYLHENNIPIFIALENQYTNYHEMIQTMMGFDH